MKAYTMKRKVLHLTPKYKSQSKKYAATMRNEHTSQIMTRLIREDVGKFLEVLKGNENMKSCKICGRRVKSGHKCALKAIKKWVIDINVKSVARCPRNTRKRITKKRKVLRKTKSFRRIRRNVRNNTSKMRTGHKKSICRKRRGRSTVISTRRITYKRSVYRKNRALVKRSKSSKSCEPHDQNTTRRSMKRSSHRRHASTRSVRRRSATSCKSLVRDGHRMRAPKRSQNLGSLKWSHCKKITFAKQSRKTKSCPPTI